jgi:predicted DNA-binding protein YlxM (UPF0122 family)
MNEYLWEDIPESIDFAERNEIKKQIIQDEIEQERRMYERFRNNREPFEWCCYEDVDSVA